MKRVVIVPGTDPRTTAHVVGLLLANGIEVTRLTQAAASRAAHGYLGGPATARTFPAGSYVIDLSQPQRRLAKGMLEPDAEFDRGFVERELGKFQRNRRRGEGAKMPTKRTTASTTLRRGRYLSPSTSTPTGRRMPHRAEAPP